MRNRNSFRLSLAVIVLLFPVLLGAQTNRVVRGAVFSPDGARVSGAQVTASHNPSFTAVSDDNGQFSISIPPSETHLTITASGYESLTQQIDAIVMVFNLSYDKARKAAVDKEERERLAAQKAAEQAAEERARLEAEQKAAKMQHLRDSIARERQAMLAREQAVKDSLAAMEAARQKAVKDSTAAVKKQQRLKAVQEYDKKYKNHGFVSSLDLSYGYQLSKGEVVYKGVGWQNYGDLMPVSLNYYAGYRFNYLCTLSAGVGVLYHIKSITPKGDTFADFYKDFKEKQVDVSVSVKLSTYMTKGKIQPMFSAAGGLYVLSMRPFVDAGLGCNFRCNKSFSTYILADFSLTPWPSFDADNSVSAYKSALTPGIKLGLTF